MIRLWVLFSPEDASANLLGFQIEFIPPILNHLGLDPAGKDADVKKDADLAKARVSSAGGEPEVTAEASLK